MTTGAPVYDPYDPEVQEDPYPMYQALREYGPVLHLEDLNIWVVTHLDEVVTAATAPTLTATRGIANLDPFPDDPSMLGPGVGSITNSDPPRHTEMRRIIHKVFSAKTFKAWQPGIDRIAAELVEDLLAKSDPDIVTDLAEPLPALVMLSILGLPLSDAPQLRQWGGELLAVLPGLEKLGMEGAIKALGAMQAMTDYVERYVDGKGPTELHPDGVIALLLEARDDTTGEGLTRYELIGNILALINGGLETTTNAIANGMVAFLHHPDQLARVRADAELLNGAVEEILRYDPPIQATHRTALEETKIGDTLIPAGGRVQLCWGAANRDEAVFSDGDTFDITRQGTKPHIAFGTGIHFCVGAQLGRVGARTAFRELFDRTTEINPAGDPVVKPEFFPTLRGRTHVPVRCR